MSGNNLGKLKYYIPKHFICGEISCKDQAVLTYEDINGKIKCETSWKSELGIHVWTSKAVRDTFKTTIYENVPTAGFKLLKHRYSHGYGYLFTQDKNLCIIEDPRGFSFCITLDNLLWILETEGIEKTSGLLTGEYCMAWVVNMTYTNVRHGLLIPTSSPVYKETIETSKKMATKLSIKDLVPGNIYQIKSLNKELPYVGAFKVAIDLGERYKTVHLFQYVKNHESLGKDYVSIEGRENLIPVSIQNVLYDTGKKIDPSKVKELSTLFEKTAYSYSFWKNNASEIFEIIDLSTVADKNKLPISGNYNQWMYVNWGVSNSTKRNENNKTGDLVGDVLTLLRPVQYFNPDYTKETQRFTELLRLTPKKIGTGYDIEKLDKLGKYNRYLYFTHGKTDFKVIYPETKLDLPPKEYIDKGKRIVPGILTKDLYIDDSIYAMTMLDLENFMDASKIKNYFLPWKS